VKFPTRSAQRFRGFSRWSPAPNNHLPHQRVYLSSKIHEGASAGAGFVLTVVLAIGSLSGCV
jgi:hypothetical protein